MGRDGPPGCVRRPRTTGWLGENAEVLSEGAVFVRTEVAVSDDSKGRWA